MSAADKFLTDRQDTLRTVVVRNRQGSWDVLLILDGMHYQDKAVAEIKAAKIQHEIAHAVSEAEEHEWAGVRAAEKRQAELRARAIAATQSGTDE